MSPYATYGEKLIRLFAKLLFTGKSYSLTELSRMLDCSKQTVLRLIDDIQRSYGVEIEEHFQGRQKFYRIRHRAKLPPALNLTLTEMEILHMCQAFARHLLGRTFLHEATSALEKSLSQIEGKDLLASSHFSTYSPGSIDYTAHEASIRTLLQALEHSRICQVSYRSLSATRAKNFFIMPLKIFSHHDTIYLSARYAGKPGQPHKPRQYDPLLAIHRIRKVELTERTFTFPSDYDFETIYNHNFGIIKQEAFAVEAEFSGHAARYVSERIWSPDQTITPLENDRLRLSFQASSRPELVAWILSFGHEARLLSPTDLIPEIKAALQKMLAHY